MKTIYFIFAFFILSTFLAVTIINVPADQPTIQEGINVAVDGDTVLVQPDTYIENINFKMNKIIHLPSQIGSMPELFINLKHISANFFVRGFIRSASYKLKLKEEVS